jgi:hypothetical protein
MGVSVICVCWIAQLNVRVIDSIIVEQIVHSSSIDDSKIYNQ